MTKKLQRSLDAFKQSKEPVENLLYGELGVTMNGQRMVSVENRYPFVYVRLRSNTSEIIQAFNDKVSNDYGLPVTVKRDGSRYVLVGRDTERYNVWDAPNPRFAPHGSRHSFDKDGGNVGDDLAYIYSYQFMPNQVSPFNLAGATNVFIRSAPYEDVNGDWKFYGNTGTVSLVNYNAQGSGSSLVIITLDMSTGNPYLIVTSGTYIPSTASGIAQLLPYLPAIQTADSDLLPLAFVRLETGTNAVDWNNVYDIRGFLHNGATGSGGGGISSVAWGDITGNIANQTDLQAIIDGLSSGTSSAPELSYLITEDLTSQITGTGSHFNLTWQALAKCSVYCNLRQLPSDVTMDSTMLGFTLSYTPTTADKLVVDYYLRDAASLFVYDDSGDLVIDDSGDFVLSEM